MVIDNGGCVEPVIGKPERRGVGACAPSALGEYGYVGVRFEMRPAVVAWDMKLWWTAGD